MDRPSGGPHIVLADEHIDSARRLQRALDKSGHFPKRFEWLGNGPRASRILAGRLASDAVGAPQVIISGLTAHDTASSEFIAALAPLARTRNTLIFALAPTLEATTRVGLLRAGADAVFVRHTRLLAYREEVAHMMAFWARHAVPNRIRA